LLTIELIDSIESIEPQITVFVKKKMSYFFSVLPGIVTGSGRHEKLLSDIQKTT
jgi:hypothetical protein